MKVLVYVEGPSDKLSMEQLLEPLIARCAQAGIEVSFHEAPPGDKKKSVLLKVPVKAVNILRGDPAAMVVALPDLYPRDKGFRHSTFTELEDGIQQRFKAVLREKGLADDERLQKRFRVFCCKHDLEALVLAAEKPLAEFLGVQALPRTWTLPVEDQNHNVPPKRVVERLFEDRGLRYKDTVDAPRVLGSSGYDEIAARCDQCFQPFVAFLEGIVPSAR